MGLWLGAGRLGGGEPQVEAIVQRGVPPARDQGAHARSGVASLLRMQGEARKGRERGAPRHARKHPAQNAPPALDLSDLGDEVVPGRCELLLQYPAERALGNLDSPRHLLVYRVLGMLRRIEELVEKHFVHLLRTLCLTSLLLVVHV